jgi:adenosylcobinamide-phosphate synthase
MSWLVARLLSVALALALDLLLGDPRYRLHPVRLLGSAISAGERALRRTRLSDRAAGTVLTVAAVALAGGVALALSLLAWSYAGPIAGIAADALLVYFALAGRSLADEGSAIRGRVDAADLPGARTALAGIVGRDTEALGESEIARATIETLGENSVDALIAPAFWALLLGPAGAWLHKAASTLDSMVGYRNERYERFGTPSARLDDALAWVPARLAIPLVAMGAAAIRCDWRAAWRTGLRDRLKHASPNSAHGEAAFAGALGVRLGGIAYYAGVPSQRSSLGVEYPAPRGSDVRAAVRLLLVIETLLLASAGMAALLAFAVQ